MNDHKNKCSMHNASMAAMENFMSVKRGEGKAVNIQLNDHIQKN